jgi:hypothetical protein
MFPTCSEILEVIRNLGYQKPSAESATEPAEAATDPTANDAEANPPEAGAQPSSATPA